MDMLEVVTVGFPFCGFKVLAGLTLGGRVGAAFVVWGALDCVVNAANLASLLAARRRAAPACLFSFAARALRGSSPRWQELGNSLDVLVSFVIVAAMIGLGRIPTLPPRALAAWNACVILNVLGAGLGRVGASVLAL